jgi:hypothetical protein
MAVCNPVRIRPDHEKEPIGEGTKGAGLTAQRLLIEEGEPPCKRLVDLEARNDECRPRGFPPDELVTLSKWQRRFGRYADFGLQRLEDWKASRQRIEERPAAT